jgi:hypothetical protein
MGLITDLELAFRAGRVAPDQAEAEKLRTADFTGVDGQHISSTRQL